MSILESLALNWVQYQFSHGIEMTTIRILLFGWLLHSLLESLEGERRSGPLLDPLLGQAQARRGAHP